MVCSGGSMSLDKRQNYLMLIRLEIRIFHRIVTVVAAAVLPCCFHFISIRFFSGFGIRTYLTVWFLVSDI